MHTVELKVIDPRLGNTIPFAQYATNGAAGLDLRACLEAPFTLHKGETTLIPAGFAMHIKDHNLAALILPALGWGIKKGLCWVI